MQTDSYQGLRVQNIEYQIIYQRIVESRYQADDYLGERVFLARNFTKRGNK